MIDKTPTNVGYQRIACVKLLILFVLLTTCLTAQAGCNDAQIERAILQSPSHGTVEALACSTSETTGNVAITVSVNGNRMATVHTTYESNAYVPSIDTTIRFGKNHEQGFGVSTGRGRGGNGMHYWTISGNGAQLIDLGEAPALTRDPYSKETYSALIPSTGDYQSVRYFYEIKDNAFVAVKAIAFSTPNPKFFTVTTILFEKDGQVIIGRKRTLSLKQGIACMEGNNRC
jgi:hypothetical protein